MVGENKFPQTFFFKAQVIVLLIKYIFATDQLNIVMKKRSHCYFAKAGAIFTVTA